ncbi:MAG TPA: glyceraldehyde 3-phosphate dehydrogenase NAD-binding domain-containing protein, partial [Thermodesulfovibrionales bacterium]|nr:glyceraldehyde 3-phosphate dehydrogenase NAD-binding domain-containing protein [Thermodesulfovibrionales bacterium]
GTSLGDIALYIEKDSTYGALHHYLYGFAAKRIIDELDEDRGTMRIDGMPVKILRENRNPKDIPWSDHGVRIVVDATGKFTDPAVPADLKEGALRGHIEAGAEKVIVSAPFKIREKGRPMPEDAKTIIMGINEGTYEPAKHHVISAASCTTTCLAHMIKPLVDHFGAKRMLNVFVATAHAVTNSQEVLDSLPKAGATDLRKTRSVMNNIILTSTGAADTLGLVIPEMNAIGLIAESVRIPLTTGSLIVLVVAFHDEPEKALISREVLNSVYAGAARRERRGYLKYTEEQNVSTDIIGYAGAAVIIEGSETRARSAFVDLEVSKVCSVVRTDSLPSALKIAVTQAVVYGWYDNELGSFSTMLGDLTVRVASMLPQ